MDKFDSVKKQLDRDFSNHVVEITEMGNGLKSVLWRRPGTLRGSVEYLFRNNMLIVSGDYGSAIYSGARVMQLSWLADLDISYFSTLVDASPGGRDFSEWDPAVAKNAIRNLCKSSIDALCVDSHCANEIWDIFEQDGRYGIRLKEPEDGQFYEQGFYDDQGGAFDMALSDEQIEMSYVHEERLELFRQEYEEMISHTFSREEWRVYLDNASSEVREVLFRGAPHQYEMIGDSISSNCMVHLIGLKMVFEKCPEFDGQVSLEASAM